MATWQFQRPKMPVRVVALSCAALLAPVGHTVMGAADGLELLVWLLALVPAFLLAYYRGWAGAATALAGGMAVLALSQVLVLALGRPEPREGLVLAIVGTYMGVALGAGWLSERLHAQRESAELLALTDDLTSVPNRRRARMFLDTEFAAAAMHRPLAVVLFDLDSFKKYNDTHGHGAGDVALCNFARALHAATGEGALSARYGGEEFLSVLPASDGKDALAFVARVKDNMQASHPEAAALTASAGIACYAAWMDSPSELLMAADEALYEAKQEGPDSCRMAGRALSVA